MNNTTSSQVLIQKVIWLAMVASVFIYGAVLYVVVQQNLGLPANPIFADIQYIVYALAVGAIGMAVAFPQMIKKLTAREKAPVQRQNELHVQFILRLVFLEAAALFGFILSFLSYDLTHYFLLASAALVGMLMLFPRAAKVKMSG